MLYVCLIALLGAMWFKRPSKRKYRTRRQVEEFEEGSSELDYGEIYPVSVHVFVRACGVVWRGTSGVYACVNVSPSRVVLCTFSVSCSVV